MSRAKTSPSNFAECQSARPFRNGRGRLYPPGPSAVIIVHLIDGQAVATLQF